MQDATLPNVMREPSKASIDIVCNDQKSQRWRSRFAIDRRKKESGYGHVPHMNLVPLFIFLV